MKQFILFAALVLTFACKKNSTGTEEDNTTTTLRTKEYLTGISLSGVSVQLYRCSNYDALFGCQSTSLFATYTTDANGECKIKNSVLSKADEGVMYKKPRYWETEAGEAMEPEATVEVNLKAGKLYPDTLQVSLITTSQTGLISTTTFKAPKDSLVNFRIFGNAKNEIDWTLHTEGICLFYCSADTVAKGHFTVQAQKFENVKAPTVVY